MDSSMRNADFMDHWNAVRPPMEPALLADDGNHVVQLMHEYHQMWQQLERTLEERLEVLSDLARGAA